MVSYGGAGCVDCYREHCRQQVPSMTTPDSLVWSSRRGRTGSRRFDITPRSCRLFLAGSFVIGLILVPCTMSAPVKQQPQQQHQRRLSASIPRGQPFWHDPCGTQQAFDGSGCGGAGSGIGHDMMMDADAAMRREEDEILSGIISSANQALMQVEQFTELFVSGTFGMDVKNHHAIWKDTTFVWLNQSKYMPKKLDVPLEKSHLARLNFRNVLHAVYMGMQNVAVGMEQVVLDQEQERLPFVRDFRDITLQIKTILCELSMAIYEINDTPEPPVSRDIMPIEVRISQGNRSLRDWLILRAYITGLQYLIEALEYLRS